ncbi:MAG: hypothetical protein KJ770_01135, partial [Actinobacteria bacterium]|nr:hypothetical protein [Actinomycetota bacterium]MCG2790067.1 hypothetical protein [Actinomycetes bacterium]
FYTCTISPIENQNVIEKFLKSFRGEYTLEKPPVFEKLAKILTEDFRSKGISEDKGLEKLRNKGCFEIMPYYFNSEAGFVCSLIKNSY